MAEINDGTKKIKVIAFYLPQYHTIPENDKAWGKGFTEWVNVKKAKPYFKGHYQPRIPLNNNYYNLLNPDAQIWQSNLAAKYNVFGFCYYHYWFKNGKMLLEQPAENMLKNEEIKQPFCFCWANENWTKAWTGGEDDVIVEQDYGGREEWKKHFEYLLPFFKDGRYITIDSKPVFIIYKPELIPNFREMVKVFREEADKNGLPGIEIMIQFPNYRYSATYDSSAFDYYIDFEPTNTLMRQSIEDGEEKRKNIIRKILGKKLTQFVRIIIPVCTHKNYDDVWESIISRNENFNDDKVIPGAFTDWDNSARKRRSVVFDGATPEKFNKYFYRLAKTLIDSNRLNVIFINAWNEWGEGAYLEPDEKNGYEYLESIKRTIENIE